MQKILLIGGGNMGQALVKGWLRQEMNAHHILVVDPHISDAFAHELPNIHIVKHLDLTPTDFHPDALVLAVKPQAMADVLRPLKALPRQPGVYLSIAAGKTLASFALALGDDAPVVRAMPNTPAAIGRGMSVACPNTQVAPSSRALCDRLLSAVGEVAWIDDESLLDAVTAVSGSGPAYVFLLIESMAAAGIAAGLPEPLALQLARITVDGAGELARRLDISPAQLRQNVTSPNGTTQAALEILMSNEGLPALMRRAVMAATRRSRELAG